LLGRSGDDCRLAGDAALQFELPVLQL